MKKILSIMACLALTASVSGTALAGGGTDKLTNVKNQQSIDIEVACQNNTVIPDVYSVDIEWQDMIFTYNASGTKTWNPVTHMYTAETTGQWSKDAADITVINHSNRSIEVVVSYENDNQIGVDVLVTNGTFTIESAVDKAVDAPELKQSATLTISGIPDDQTAKDMKVGQVTITIK